MRQLHSFFCDDVRNELGGKISYIGVYSGKLYVPSFPVIIPKLCLVAFASTPRENPFSTFALRLLKDDEVVLEQSIPAEAIAQAMSSLGDSMPNNKYDKVHVLNMTLVLSPFPIQSPCALRVRGITESGELRGHGLGIELTPSQ